MAAALGAATKEKEWYRRIMSRAHAAVDEVARAPRPRHPALTAPLVVVRMLAGVLDCARTARRRVRDEEERQEASGSSSGDGPQINSRATCEHTRTDSNVEIHRPPHRHRSENGFTTKDKNSPRNGNLRRLNETFYGGSCGFRSVSLIYIKPDSEWNFFSGGPSWLGNGEPK